MAQSPDNSSGDGDKAESEATTSGDRKAQDRNAQDRNAQDRNGIDKNLPMVVAPKLGAGEDEPLDETVETPADEAVAAAAPAHSPRFLMLAASVAFAAAFGSFIGSVSGAGLSRFIYPPTPVVQTESASTADTLRAMKQQLAELSTIKANLDSTSRSTTSQMAKIADRLDRLDQHASAGSETTGTIAAVPASAPPQAPAAAPAVEQPKLTDRILEDWVVQDVQNGRALVASRYGGMFDVGAGSVLPGVGRVDGIKRQDGQWLVLTARGTITSGR